MTNSEFAEDTQPDAITCPCREPRCGRNCHLCDGDGYGFATVTPFTVIVFGTTYDRGAESEARISEACDLVDPWCRDAVRGLLIGEVFE